MVARAEFANDDVSVSPGTATTLDLTLANLGNRTETFTLVPSGLLAGWVRIDPPTVTLFGGSQETITVTLKPPQLSTTPAGPAPLTVRVIPQDEPDDVIIAETTANIGAFDDRRLHLLQPAVRSRRRATFEFLVENEGNSQASCRLHLIDVSHRLDGDFDPPAVGVEPGGNSLVRLKLKAVRRQWHRGSRTLPFSIEADQQGFPTATATATLIQTPVLPERLGRRFLALVLVAALLGGAWFGLLRPLTERTARDAVDGTVSAIVVTTSPAEPVASGDVDPTATTTPTSNTTAAPVTVAAPTAVGNPITTRLPATALLDQSGTAQVPVPAEKEWRITDLILQNSNDDGGFASVLRNDALIQRWNLSTSVANIDPLQLFTPIIFRPGDVITFQVDCESVGSPSGMCDVGLLISGLEYPG